MESEIRSTPKEQDLVRILSEMEFSEVLQADETGQDPFTLEEVEELFRIGEDAAVALKKHGFI